MTDLDTWKAARKPHRFLVEIEDAECRDAYDTAIRAGRSIEEAECCNPLCYRVVKIECPYGDGWHVDCSLWMECSCISPDDDPQYDASANFTYKFDMDKPVGDPDRYVRVWEEGSTAEGIALALAFELAMEEYEEKHDNGSGYEKVEPEKCWVASWAEGVEEALEQELGELRVGWFEAYVSNSGDISESYLELELVPIVVTG